uniref:F-box/FBD/LRR-repeat protein At1g13570-like n=1 Tax=Erigeron canadensis TaxID=72917 RepID=UPI001CB8A5F7|nr:F-box/FBD/LRR-repeat protein At1g13570-like [Erigeron canadensis]
MEPFHGHIKHHQYISASEVDVISKMPENVVTHILDRLSIQDAVGTSILSKSWRFKWTMLTQLVFDTKKYYDERNLSRLLLQLKGPIKKFVLHIPNYKVLDVKDINHWIMFLSGKGIQEFTLINYHQTPLKLHTHLFSCLDLKHLNLHNCCLSLTPTFSGFPNLLTLDLFRVTFESGSCCQLIIQCPLLENLKVSYHNYLSGNLKLVEIAKLKNLRVLSLPLCKLDYMVITVPIILQFGIHFPRLQELSLDFQNCKCSGELDGNYKMIRNTFPSLKTLTISQINFSGFAEVACAMGIISTSPNLRTLNMTAAYTQAFLPYVFCSTDSAQSILGQLQLQDVVFRSCKGSRIEVVMIKFLLAGSPLLKKMVIHSDSSLSSDEKLVFATTLLKLSRASHTAKVDFL